MKAIPQECKSMYIQLFRRWTIANIFILVRILCTGDFIFSSSYDKTIKAWLFDTSELDEGSEDKACIRTFKGHSKGVYPLIFIPAEESLVLQNEDGPVINPGDLLISGKLGV